MKVKANETLSKKVALANSGITRRTFFKTVGGAAGTLALSGAMPLILSGKASGSVQMTQIPLPGKDIPKYVDPMPTFVGARVDAASKTALTIGMEELQQMVMPAEMYAGLSQPYDAGTYVWGYRINDGTTNFGPMYPGYTVEAKKGVPVTVHYVNNLGTNTVFPVLQKYISVDQTIHWADPLGNMAQNLMTPYVGPVPAVTHLHGGEVPSASDGGPDSWFTPGLMYMGPSWNEGVTDIYNYPNSQEAATLWFHDHALGATRLNVYCGLAGFYFLRDGYDTGLMNTLPNPDANPSNLPSGSYETEIVFQDRSFDTNGQWRFPDVGVNPTVHPFWLPEFFGDTIVVNGKTWPYLEVEPRRYRLRLLNGSNARFYELRLLSKAAGGSGLPIWQIGTDGGLLDAPVMLDGSAGHASKRLLIAPGERADVIVDFGAFAGQTITLVNSAKAPFPKGAAPNPQTVGKVMQFRVNLPLNGTDTSFDPASTGATLRGGAGQPAAIVRLATAGDLAPDVTPDVNRLLTLNEFEGPLGPLAALVNNTLWDGELSPNAGGVTETPRVGSTEVWEIVNLTVDAHPIHLHLVQAQLINRQRFNASRYSKEYEEMFPEVEFNGEDYDEGEFIPAYGPPMPYGSTPKLGGNPDVTPYLQGPVRQPNPNESGWKDTFVMYPGEVTRIVMRYAPQEIAVGDVSAGINRYPFDPTAGPGYVWHCHILDHEDNEMMRDLKVKP
jgi:spore coat protein A